MNTKLHFPSFAPCIIAIAAIFHPLALRAESVEPPVQISLQFESFSLSLEDAAALMADPMDDGERLRRVRLMEKEGKAREERLVIARTRSGQRMVAESIDEVRYATEFGAASFGTLDERNRDLPKDAPHAELKPTDPEVTHRDELFALGVIPTAFETRNTGETVEIEPVIGPDGKTIDINLVPQVVYYAGEREVKADKKITQPLFETQKLTTTITVESGHPFLLGTINPPFGTGLSKDDKAHQIWLQFITGYVVSSRGKIVSDSPISPATSGRNER